MHTLNKCVSFLYLAAISSIFISSCSCSETSKQNQTPPELKAFQEKREHYIRHFRVHGKRNNNLAMELEQSLKQFLQDSKRPQKSQALVELATLYQISGRHQQAINTFHKAIDLAANKQAAYLFDAWMGIARSHIYDTNDHGEANFAFRNAESIGKIQNKLKHRIKLAGYNLQLLASRGELDLALFYGLKTLHLTKLEKDKYKDELFYAHLDTADVLQKFAEICDYRAIEDSINQDNANISGDYSACQRAVAAAKSQYEQAAVLAKELGWRFLVSQTNSFINRLQIRSDMIKAKEKQSNKLKNEYYSLFSAQNPKDVVVNEAFDSGASQLTDQNELAILLKEVIADTESLSTRSIFLLGNYADMQGEPKKALQYYLQAYKKLMQERSSFLDFRRRSTVVESRPEIVRDLALRLLHFKQYQQAFDVFESIRSFGMSQLAYSFNTQQFSEKERQWLATLIERQAEASKQLKKIARDAIAYGVTEELLKSSALLDELLQSIKQDKYDKEFVDTSKKLQASNYQTPSLQKVKTLVKERRVPALFYWVTGTNVIVWLITPDEMLVKAVFLPQSTLAEKVQRARDSARKKDIAYSKETAKQLYTYLIAPFKQALSYKTLAIIPQGELISLAFEALIDPESDNYLIEKSAISYFPNAEFLARSLSSQPNIGANNSITAIYDESIESGTKEITKLKSIPGIKLNAYSVSNLEKVDFFKNLQKTPSLHLLMHGNFDRQAPLLSWLSYPNYLSLEKDERFISAANLLTANWQNTRLVVFSACEGAEFNRRISNEVYGLSWAPLVGGVESLVFSRWQVMAESNAQWADHFYSALTNSKTRPSAAATLTMRKMLKEFKHPYYWAGPQMFGL